MPVVINADDFGLSQSVNSTIISLHQKGIISSTTIMANSPCFDDAVILARENPGLGTGVHLCLDGPFNIGQDYLTIMDPESKKFYTNHQIIQRLKRFSVDEQEVFKEYSMQIEKVLDYKLRISHLDHHHHLHLYWQALSPMIRAAKKFKINYIRSQIIFLHHNNNYFNFVYRRFHQFYVRARIKTVSGYFDPGIREDSDPDLQLKRLKMLLEIKNKTIEIVLHPSLENDPETTFFVRKDVKNILVNHKILNYNTIHDH